MRGADKQEDGNTLYVRGWKVGRDVARGKALPWTDSWKSWLKHQGAEATVDGYNHGLNSNRVLTAGAQGVEGEK